LAAYLHQAGLPQAGEPVWRTVRGETRPLSYWALRRMLQRANTRLGTDWTAHDLRHTAAARMVADPGLTLPEVQTVLRHRHLSSTQVYLRVNVEELFAKLQEHFHRPRPAAVTLAAGYDPADMQAVFGG
jgi:integrase